MNRRIVSIGSGVAALLVLVAAAAWACTATHQGQTWFCAGSSACATGMSVSTLDNDNTYTQVISSDMDKNTTFDLWYKSDHDQENDCAETATGTFGELTTDSSGEGSKVIDITSISTIDYTACPAIDGGFSTGPAHVNFTVVN